MTRAIALARITVPNVAEAVRMAIVVVSALVLISAGSYFPA